jgi:hypothetical protein
MPVGGGIGVLGAVIVSIAMVKDHTNGTDS